MYLSRLQNGSSLFELVGMPGAVLIVAITKRAPLVRENVGVVHIFRGTFDERADHNCKLRLKLSQITRMGCSYVFLFVVFCVVDWMLFSLLWFHCYGTYTKSRQYNAANNNNNNYINMGTIGAGERRWSLDPQRLHIVCDFFLSWSHMIILLYLRLLRTHSLFYDEI